MRRSAYTSEEKATATSLSFQIGAKAAAAQTGIPLNTLHQWRQRRNAGQALNATPVKPGRHPRSERPVSPEIPESVHTVDEDGRIRTPRSLFISVAPATGWYFEDRSGITVALRKYRHEYQWQHVAVAAFAVLERVNVGEPPYREVVGLVPRAEVDQQVMLDECFHESELSCLVSGRCKGHRENLDNPISEKVS